MLYRLILVSTFVLMMLAGTSLSHASTVVSFGYLANKSSNSSYDYLETLFPNSFASSLSAVFDVKIKKPQDIDKDLKKRFNVPLKKEYEPYELPPLMEQIGTDIFIFGSFEPLRNSQVKIVIHIFLEGSNEMFTFTNVGQMETEIFKLVDRISLVVLDFLQDDHLFKSTSMKDGSRVAILTNIEGVELNNLYASMMKLGYRILCFQSNEIRNYMKQEEFHKLKYIRSKENSYDTISDWRKLKLFRGSWTGIRYNTTVSYLQRIYKIYDLNYLETKLKLLDRLSKAFKGKADYLFIIGFDEKKNRAWVRCVDIEKKELIWMKSTIWHVKGEPVNDIVSQAIALMRKERKNPFMGLKRTR